jgi:hypothetical protein
MVKRSCKDPINSNVLLPWFTSLFYLMGIIEITITVNSAKLVFDMKTIREKKRKITFLISITMIIL